MNSISPHHWLPEGKSAAICFTIDDVHPASSADLYEAGGDLGRGALQHVEWLLNRHAELKVTLFVTPDWRQTAPRVTRHVLASIPYVRERAYLARRLPKGTMRLSRHPQFVQYIRQLPRTEVGIHGLHHIHRGNEIPIEFQQQSLTECRRMLEEAMAIFEEAQLPYVAGITPPGFNAPPDLLAAMQELGLRFVASARDINTPIAAAAVTAMTGLHGVPLIRPHRLVDTGLVHIPTNFQATSTIDRAFSILEHGGLLSIKAHIVKNALGYIALDGLDALYRNYLDILFSTLRSRFGETLWWTSPSEITERFLHRDEQTD